MERTADDACVKEEEEEEGESRAGKMSTCAHDKACGADGAEEGERMQLDSPPLLPVVSSDRNARKAAGEPSRPFDLAVVMLVQVAQTSLGVAQSSL